MSTIEATISAILIFIGLLGQYNSLPSAGGYQNLNKINEERPKILKIMKRYKIVKSITNFAGIVGGVMAILIALHI